MVLSHFKRLAGLALVAASIGGAPLAAQAAEPGATGAYISDYSVGMSRTVKLGLNKSIVVDLPRDARDILVSNPVIADAVIRTPRRIYLTGVAVGQSNVVVFDRAGQQIVSLDLEVERDTGGLVQMLNRLIPDSDINVEIVSDNIVLTGFVRNQADSRRAQDIANVFANGGAQAGGASGVTAGSGDGVAISSGSQVPTSAVINLLSIEGEDQVQIKVTVAEVNRSLVKQLGISWQATGLDIGGLTLAAQSALPYKVNGAQLGPVRGGVGFSNGGNITATINALEEVGLFRTLAEPTLTAISGESASFLAGGEFPVPVGRDGDSNTVTIEFKQYGVALAFTPVVLSEGRISMRMKTEVSELSQDGAIQLADVSLPSLKVRRADTTLELPSGGSMVIGGLLQDNVRQSLGKMPGLGNLPVLGALFRSRDFQRSETELVIIATPYLVKPVSRSQLATPDQGFATPNDTQSNFFGALNRRYGTATGQYQGQAGFIFE